MRGGYGAGDHGTLAERLAATTSRPPPARMPSSPARHCVVDGEPSLLVEWARTDRGWEGRVVSVVWLEGVGWAMVERWLPAAAIVAV
jgi:hypothetical protein